jgi:protein SCO1/2
MQAVLEYFECGVNYIGSVVNQHTTELFIVGGDGKVKRRFARLQWNVPDVVARLKKLLHKEQKIKTGPAPVKSRMSGLFSALLSFFVVFFPKCPLCWAAYLSILGITNIGVLRFTHWLLPVFVLLLFINLFSLYRGARRRNGFLPFYMSLSGILCIVFPGLILHMKMGSYLGLCLILPGAMLNSLSHSVFVRLRLALSRMRAGVYFNSSTS